MLPFRFTNHIIMIIVVDGAACRAMNDMLSVDVVIVPNLCLEEVSEGLAVRRRSRQLASLFHLPN